MVSFCLQAAFLTALGTEVGAFASSLISARDDQQQAEGLLDQFSAVCEENRITSATALYGVLGQLMTIFAAPLKRAQILGFFHLTLLITPPDSDEDEEDDDPPPVPPEP